MIRDRPFKNNTLFILIFLFLVFLDETKKKNILQTFFWYNIFVEIKQNKSCANNIFAQYMYSTIWCNFVPASDVILSVVYSIVYCCPLESHVPLYYCTYRQLYQMGTFTVHIGHTPDCPIPIVGHRYF